jgi:DNA modification methylase
MNLSEKPETNNHVAESYNGIYSMHKYWSKKPFNIIRDFVLNYSKKGEIVLDPFCGSGISVAESIFANRKAIGIDINPSAIFITKQMLNKISSKKLNEEYENLEKYCRDKINSFYLIERNGKHFIGTHFLWKNENLIEIWYQNGKGRNSKVVDLPTKEDIAFAKSFTYEKIPYYYPKRNFFHNSRINAKRDNKVYDLFTPRNLMALSFLLDSIEKIEDDNIREILKFIFTSATGQASKMVFVVKRRGKFNGQLRKTEKKEVGSWVIGYWVPKENFEINVWNCFKNKFKKILKAKRVQEYAQYNIIEANNFTEIENSNKNLLLINDSAVNFLKNIPDNSVDYIITDPPHGNRMPFLEQSMMWNEWLKKKVNYEDEIVISESKDRNKNIENYNFLLNQVFKQIERILKPKRYFSLIFNSLDDKTWINLIQFMSGLNFDLHKVETLGYSANSVVQDNRGGALKTDFVLTFRKNPNKIKKEIELYFADIHKKIFKDKIDSYIDKNNNGLEIYEILNNLVIDLLKQNKFFKPSEILGIIRKDYKKENNKWDRKV